MIKKFLRNHLLSVIILTISLSINGIQFSVFAEQNESSIQITIFHTNDMHGRLLDVFNKSTPPVLTQIGSDYTAAIKKSVPNSLLIDAGDAIQGLPFATISKGADVINLMNAAGYDGMVLGNHEFDYGKEQLLSNAKLASFPVISANTLENNTPFLAGINGNNGQDFIKTINGIKIGFFGITTQETKYKTNPSNISGITFEDPIKTSKSEVKKLKSEGAKVIIGIMHIGNDPSSFIRSDDIAEDVDGINVIIDGHSHTIENKIVNDTLITQTRCYNTNIGRIDINITDNGNVSCSEGLISPEDATANYTPDKSVKDLAVQINQSQAPLFSQIVGRTNTSLWAGTVNGQSVARVGETNLGDLVADAMVYGAKSQVSGTKYASLPIVALENGGGIRDSILAGNINQGQITTVLPFGNILSLKEVTPSLLYQIIENGISNIMLDTSTGIVSGGEGRFPQISGMRFEYNPNNPVSNKVNKIVLLNRNGSDKQILDKNDTETKIVLASNDYEAAGGDGYTTLSSLKNISEGNALDVITSKYIKELTFQNNGTFQYPSYQGRIKICSDFIYNPYAAEIIVKNDSTLISNASVIYAVDNGEPIQSTTDKNGILKIENLPSGPHNISIVYNNLASDSYVNDIIGSNTASSVSASLSSIDTDIPKETSDMIDALPLNITLSDKDNVARARVSYNKLTLSQKSLVTNYNKLTSAEIVISNLIGKFSDKTTVPLNKVWTVTMIQEIDYSTFSNLTVTNDTTNKNIELNLTHASNDKKSFFIRPKNSYNANTSYTVTISDLKSTSNKMMKQNTSMKFTTISK